MKKLLLGIGIISIFSLSFTNAQSINLDQCDLVAPASCFSKKAGSNIQSYTGGAHCFNAGTKIKITDSKIITFLINDGKSGYSTTKNTPISDLQSFLKEHEHTKSLIENDKYCSEQSFKDNKYGNCTREVFQEYLNKTCLEAIEDLEEEEDDEIIIISGKILNKSKNEPLSNITVSIDNHTAQTSATGEFLLNIPKLELTNKVKLLAQDFNSLYESFHLEQIFEKNTKVSDIILKKKAEDSPNSPTKTVDEANECLIGNEDKLKESTKEEHYPTALKKYQQWRANQKPSFCECEKIGKKRNEIGGCFGGQIFKWQEDQLRPKFQTGANWQDREYKGDASDITYWLQKFGGRITGILSTIAVLIITYNGFLITAAGSDDDTLSKAKDAIKWALIGLVGLNFVYIVVKTVISLPY